MLLTCLENSEYLQKRRPKEGKASGVCLKDLQVVDVLMLYEIFHAKKTPTSYINNYLLLLLSSLAL